MAQAADLSIESGAPELGRKLAIEAFQADRSSFGALMTLIRAALAVGDVEGATAAVAEALARRPLDQHALALQANVWRMSGDARFHELYDYTNYVRPYLIDAPAGWSTRGDYLRDLAAELKSAHQYRTHPFGHSVRQGSQLPDPLRLQTPAIQAFREALQGPLAAHLGHLGQGTGHCAAATPAAGRFRASGRFGCARVGFT